MLQAWCRHICNRSALLPQKLAPTSFLHAGDIATQAVISDLITALMDRHGYRVKPLWTLPTSSTNKQSESKSLALVNTITENLAFLMLFCQHLDIPFTPVVAMARSDAVHAGDIVTQAETSKLMKVVPERDGHRVELQWAVPPESKAYKVFPCSYLRYAPMQSQQVASMSVSLCRHTIYTFKLLSFSLCS